MNALLRSAALLLVLVMLPACGTLAGYKFIQEADLAGLAPGQSTRADVEKLLGRPLSASGRGRHEEVWEYRYAANTETMWLWVYFDAGGTVKTYRTVLPRLYQPDTRD